MDALDIVTWALAGFGILVAVAAIAFIGYLIFEDKFKKPSAKDDESKK